MIRVLAICKSNIFLNGIKSTLLSSGIEMVSMCNDSSEGVTCYKKIKPHIVIADANWTNKIYAIPGTKLIQQLIAYDPAAKIIIATNIYEPDVVEEMKQLKIRGYFYRSMNNILSEIVNCIRDVYEGKECFAD